MESNEGGVVAAVLGVPKVVQEGFREPALGKAVMSHTQTTRCSSQVYVSRDTTTTLVHRGSCRWLNNNKHLAHYRVYCCNV